MSATATGFTNVAITGLGLVTPLGRNLAENWTNLAGMATGIVAVPSPYPNDSTRYVGHISTVRLPLDVEQTLKGELRFLNRSALFGLLAAHEAVQQSKLDLASVVPARRSLYLASNDMSMVGYEFMFPALQDSVDPSTQAIDAPRLNQAAIEKVDPFFLLKSLKNNLFSGIAGLFEFMGPNASLASHSPCGSMALELAARSVQQGRADAALAVAHGHWTSDVPLYELEALGLLSSCCSGARSFRPFDRSRNGFIPGEGAAAILLEPADIVRQRGGLIQGLVRGSAGCLTLSSTSRLGVPPLVVQRCIRQCLEGAGYGLQDLAFVCGHGSATRKGDRSELASLVELMRGEQTSVPVTGLKPYTGHMGAASDLGEIVLSLQALTHQLVPATLNFSEPDKDFALVRVPVRHEPTGKRAFLSASYGFGGQSSCTVISL